MYVCFCMHVCTHVLNACPATTTPSTDLTMFFLFCCRCQIVKCRRRRCGYADNNGHPCHCHCVKALLQRKSKPYYKESQSLITKKVKALLQRKSKPDYKESQSLITKKGKALLQRKSKPYYKESQSIIIKKVKALLQRMGL